MGGLWHCFTQIQWYHLNHNHKNKHYPYDYDKYFYFSTLIIFHDSEVSWNGSSPESSAPDGWLSAPSGGGTPASRCLPPGVIPMAVAKAAPKMEDFMDFDKEIPGKTRKHQENLHQLQWSTSWNWILEVFWRPLLLEKKENHTSQRE